MVLHSNTKLVKGKSFSIYGNALEAFIGAVFLDKGYKYCSKFILNYLISPHIDLKDIIENTTNFKSVIIEWAQKKGEKINFENVKEEGTQHSKKFTCRISVGDEVLSSGSGFSKKKSEQAAAQNACERLKIK